MTASRNLLRGVSTEELFRRCRLHNDQTVVEERELDLNAILREEVRFLERTTLSKVRLVMDLSLIHI